MNHAGISRRSGPVRTAVVGGGAFGLKHLDALRSIDDIQVVELVSPDLATTRGIADRHGIGQVGDSLDDCLARAEIEAVILCTPTPLHARQAIACMRAGKHVQVEIPMADSLADALAVVDCQRQTGLVAMCGHTRRFNPGHQWIRSKIASGQFNLQQLNVQTHFFRRTNTNALGQPRSWTDHLLWHHAAHTIDLFTYQTGGHIVIAQALQGPLHPVLGIAMDVGVQLKCSTGAICTLSLSFNNDGPFGSTFRYIGDTGTYVATYDELIDGEERLVDLSEVAVSMNGIELQDREFAAAIIEQRQPKSSVADVLPCYRTMGELEKQLR